MKIIHYCQHVLGIGHFFRSVEIARALHRHQVVLVTGGPPVEVELPPHVNEYKLPGLKMDPNFTGLFPTDAKRTAPEVQDERRLLLRSLFEKGAQDLFLVELFPFGRKRFGFELLPLLESIRRGDFGSVRVACSLRDILVEKEGQEAYERRVVDLLNRYFDALLIHADPKLVSLEETFESTAEIRIPFAYTGFVTPVPGANAGRELRKRLGMSKDEALVVASVGGGKVGNVLLMAVLEAHSQLVEERRLRLHIFTGPYMSEGDFDTIARRAASLPGVEVARFTGEFLSFLAAADLSISMAGYNTSMNLLAAGVPSLVYPFGQNREQRLRAKKLAAVGDITVVDDGDLEPSRLAELMKGSLKEPRTTVSSPVSLDGAQETARWLEAWCGERGDLV